MAPGVPTATVTWSMIPQGAPTTWFSASWHSAASRSGSSAPAPSARAVATSSAALDDTPTDCGTSDDTTSRTRGGSIEAVAHENDGDADDVVRPARVLGERGADLGIRESRQRRQLVDREGHGADDERVGGLGDDGGGDLGRHLEHERAGVVGDAAEQIEAAGRATARADHRRAP